MSQSGAGARAVDLNPESESKSDLDQRGGRAEGGGHSSIIPPREDRWRVLLGGLAPAHVAENPVTGSGGRRHTNRSDTGAVPTCSLDRRSPPGHRAALTPGLTGTHRDFLHNFYICIRKGGARCSTFSSSLLLRFSGRNHGLSPVSGRYPLPLLVFFQQPINARRSPAPLYLQPGEQRGWWRALARSPLLQVWMKGEKDGE